MAYRSQRSLHSAADLCTRWDRGTFYSMTHTVNIKAVRSDWQSKGFSCDVWTDPPGQVWEDYRHSVDEVVMVLEGHVEFEIAGKIVRPAPGEELLIPAGALHTVRNLGTSTSRWLFGYKATG